MNETITEGFRLSAQQRRLWFSITRDRNSSYCSQAAVVITGEIDDVALASAIHSVIERYEILRTTFPCPRGMKTPLQVISTGSGLTIELRDLSAMDDRKCWIEIDSILQVARRQPFDLERSPLVRMNLLTLSPLRRVLLICLSSLCGDMATLRNMVREIGASYAANRRGEEISRQPFQYVDFSEWHLDLLEDSEADAGKGFWRSEDLSGLQGLKLPSAREAGAEFEPQAISLTIDTSGCGAVKSIARRYEASTATVLLTCWQILLSRITSESEIIIGVGFDGRQFEQLKEAMGSFAKYLPVRSRLERGCSLADLLAQTESAAERAGKWQDYFVLDSEKASRDFFRATFDYERWPEEEQSEGIALSIRDLYSCFDRFTIRLAVFEKQDSIVTEFHYDARVLGAEAARLLGGQYHSLLESACENPEIGIESLNMLSEARRHAMLFEFNDTSRTDPPPSTVHHMIEDQVERAPDRIGVVFEDQSLSYFELNRRANQLAHHLISLGAGPEVPLAICADHSLEMLVAIFATMKAGAAYLPLAPTLPSSRIALMIADSGAGLFLTQHHLEAVASKQDAKVVYLDRDWPSIALEGTGNPQTCVGPENAAYLLFTSGSTGVPKAVVVEHRQVQNYIESAGEALSLYESEHYAIVSSFMADLGHTTLFPSLSFGGTLHVLSPARAMSEESMRDYFERCPIDVLKITPSHMDALLGRDEGAGQLPLRRLVLGGEALSRKLAARLKSDQAGCAIYNHYGPTETTVGALTCGVDTGSMNDMFRTVPIGRPLANVQVYLLDGRLQPVPEGAIGEIYIGGRGVARGYLNRPDLTAERFLPEPYAQNPGSRFYRTGDLGRLQLTGVVEFLGRCDNQVKIRGFRVEPGEVEAVLGGHPSVRGVAVVTREVEEESERTRLVAYLVPKPDSEVAPEQLLDWLRARLPEHMIPAVFVELETFPLSPNGKIDKRALPAPEEIGTGRRGRFVAPRNPVEDLLAGIWAEILSVNDIGVNDNFFQLGGDSLAAIRITSRIHKTFQIELLPRHIFEFPTVAGMAEFLAMGESKAGQIAAIARLRKKIDGLSVDEMQALIADDRLSSAASD